jgi:hypothetical protein
VGSWDGYDPLALHWTLPWRSLLKFVERGSPHLQFMQNLMIFSSFLSLTYRFLLKPKVNLHLTGSPRELCATCVALLIVANFTVKNCVEVCCSSIWGMARKKKLSGLGRLPRMGPPLSGWYRFILASHDQRNDVYAVDHNCSDEEWI